MCGVSRMASKKGEYHLHISRQWFKIVQGKWRLGSLAVLRVLQNTLTTWLASLSLMPVDELNTNLILPHVLLADRASAVCQYT